MAGDLAVKIMNALGMDDWLNLFETSLSTRPVCLVKYLPVDKFALHQRSLA